MPDSPFDSHAPCTITELDLSTWQIVAPEGLHVGAAGVHLMSRLLGPMVALYRRNDYWLSPAFIKSIDVVPARTLLLLAQEPDGSWVAVAPLIGRDAQVEFEGTPLGLFARIATGHEKTVESGVPLAVAGRGEDPYALIERVLGHAIKASGTGTLLSQKEMPDWPRWLGWCTWDAFYERMTEQDFLRGIESFVDAPVRLGWVILDDGWQDGDKDRRLVSFTANEKFPQGLAHLLSAARSRLGLRYVGVWHTLQGYWLGVDPKSPIGERHKVWENGLVSPDGYEAFIRDLHQVIADAGADFVKVDNQGATHRFLGDHYAYVSGMNHIREGLESSVKTHFPQGAINCMAQESTVLYQLRGTAVMRNSDDFYPDRAQNPEEHVLQNAWNTLWTRVAAMPDWDMFQSHHPRAWWHAAARAVSGGPVYVSDRPGDQDWEVLRALTMPDGSIPRCDGYAVPARTCLLRDPRENGPPLLVWNRSGGSALIGVFNLRDESVSWPIGPPDADFEVSGVPGYVVWSRRRGFLGTVAGDARITLVTDAREWDVVVISPVLDGLSVIGVDGALNPAGWVESVVSLADSGGRGLRVALQAQGPLLLAALERPTHIRMRDGKAVPFTMNDNLVRIDLPRASGPVEIEVEI